MKFRCSMISIVTVWLAGCGNALSTENDGSPDNEEVSVAEFQAADGWTFSETVDPFTDRSIATMSTELVDDTAQLAITVACGSGRHLAYEFSAYDLDGDPLKLSRFPDSVEREFFSFNELIRYKVRVDQQKAKDRFYFNPEQRNTFMIRPNKQPFGLKSGDLRDGSQITIGLKFRDGDAVFYLDQTEPRIRTFINECRSPSSDTTMDGSDDESLSKTPEPSENASVRDEIDPATGKTSEPSFSQPSSSSSMNSEPVATSKATAARPDQPLQRMIEQRDFPHRETGAGPWQVRFELQITSAGFIRDCSITQSSGSKSIDEQTCRLITRRARFSPALDAEGSPTDSEFAADVTWKRD